MRIVRVRFRDSVSVAGIKGEVLDLTAEQASMEVVGDSLRITTPGSIVSTITHLSNVRWRWEETAPPPAKPKKK